MKNADARWEGIEQDTSTEESTETSITWADPDFSEQSACAEICAYIFSA